jgi:hypothetical protein
MGESAALQRALTRLNALWFGTSAAAACGLALGLATLVLVVAGGPPSQHLSLLGQYLPGYRVTLGGAFAGALWGAALGFLFSFPAAWVYYRGLLAHIHASSGREREAELPSVARLDVPTLALACALAAASLIFGATALLLVTHRSGEPLGPHLGLLAQVMPGYGVSWRGSLVGAGYFALAGAAAAWAVGALYNALVSRKGGGR